MKIRHTTATVAALAIGFGATTSAQAQSKSFTIPTTMSYASSPRQTWNTVLLVSAAVMVVGLIQEESSLTLLGGAGVLVSLFQLNKTGFRSEFFASGVDVVKKGAFSFGVSPVNELRPTFGQTQLQPTAYAIATFKF